MQVLKRAILLLFLLTTYNFGQQNKQCSIEKFATVNSDTNLFKQRKPQPTTIIEKLKKGEIVEIVEIASQLALCNLELYKATNFVLRMAEARQLELNYELMELRVKYTDEYTANRRVIKQLENLDKFINKLRQDGEKFQTTELIKIRSKKGNTGLILAYSLKLKFKDTCPNGYNCTDITKIIQLLGENASSFEKGKFEKTIDWQERMKTVLSNVKLSNSQTLADEITFAFNFPISSNYDADNEKYTVGILTNSRDGKVNIPIYPIVSSTFSIRESYQLKIANLGLTNVIRSKIENIEFGMSLNRAKLIDENISVAVSGRIVYPFLDTDKKEDIWFELNKIIVFDNKTGEIYKTESQINNSNQ